MTKSTGTPNVKAAGEFHLGGKIPIHRFGFGAMRLTGKGIWGPPRNPEEAKVVLKRALEIGINFIDTADSYGPEVSENLIAETLYPYPSDLIIATKGGLTSRARINGFPMEKVLFTLIRFLASCRSECRPFSAAIATRTRVFTPAVRTTIAPIRPIQKSSQPTPTVILQGNLDTGPGYSPLGLYGDYAMSNYGPFSVYRARTTNVLVRTRGYDGVYRTTVGTTETYPNLPRPGTIGSPTCASNFFKPRGPSGPRVPGDAINWLDLN